MNVDRCCPYCDGTGRIPIGSEYAATLALLRGRKRPIHGAALAKLAGCSGEAMCNRLRALESLGLAKGERDGRRVLWSITLKGQD